MHTESEISQLATNPIEFLQQHPNDFVERVRSLVFLGNDESGLVMPQEVLNLNAVAE